MLHRLARAFAVLAALAAAQASAQEPDRIPPLTFPFTLSKPGGAGPFPAVVILHDCSGLGPRSSGAPARWSAELVREGYVTIRPDSFSTRGHPQGVCTDNSLPRILYRDRARDAYSALAYLKSLPFVDPNRIGVMGGSHGGASTLATILSRPVTQAIKPGFAAAISLYPNCALRYGDWNVVREGDRGSAPKDYVGVFRPLAPLLILIGDLDDWTPAEPCRRLAETAAAAGLPVEIRIYPGAHHSFDSAAPVRFIAERINLNAASGRGATTGGNREAWDDAKICVREFFARYLKPTP